MRKAKNSNIEYNDLHNFNREKSMKEMFEEMVESHNIDDSVITGQDKHQCKEMITCPDCYDIIHTPEDYADHTCTNERRSQLDDEPPTKKAKDIITCTSCHKVFNTLDDYADHQCVKPPAHMGKGEYKLLTLGKYMLLKLVNICF